MSTSDSVVTLIRVGSEIEAEAVRGALAEAGIRAVVTGGFISGFKAEAPGDAQVLVRAADLERARRVLDKLRDGTDESGRAQADVGEPP